MTLYMHPGSAGGIVIHDDKVLVISSEYRQSIDLPKGTIEPGETIDQTALREVEEETGYRTRIVHDLGSITYDFDGRDGKRYRKTVSYFLMELADNNPPVKHLEAREDFENRWLSFTEARVQLTHDDSRAMLEKALEAR